MSQSYDDLIEQAKQASEDERRRALDELISLFAGAAYRWALLVLDDENAAYDAVQDAWLSAWLHLDQLRESAAFPAWFRQIVISSSRHTIRGEKESVPLNEEAAEPVATTPDPTEEVETRERMERIREAVQALPEHERVVTELFYFSDYPQQEIAEVLSIPLTTVKKRLQYARERLKTMIQPDIMASLDALKPDLIEMTWDALPNNAMLEWTPPGSFDNTKPTELPLLWRIPR